MVLIENLNPLSIKPYGSVSTAGFDSEISRIGFSKIKQRKICCDPASGVYYNPSSKTVIDLLDGVGMIYLGKDKDHMVPFGLDKTVILNPGIYYLVTPFLCECTIEISFQSPPVYETCARLPEPFVNPDFNVLKIITLFYQEKERNFSFRGESHDFWELTYVDKGSVQNRIEEENYPLKQGQLMLFAPGQYHTQKSLGDGAVSFLTISFVCDESVDRVLANQIFTANNEIKSLLEKIIREKQNPALYSQDMLLCLLKEILILLLRMAKVQNLMQKADTRLKHTLENEIVEKTKEYIRIHLHEKISVQDIARSIPVSNSYLSTLFKKITGESLTDAINQEKINAAKLLLRSGTCTATEVSQRLSFSSIHYFTRVFKKITGFSPGEYSKSIKE